MSAHDSLPDQYRDRAARSLAAARASYEGSWLEDVVNRLRGLDLVDWAIVFGSSLLLSVLPLIILLGALGNERIDDDLSRHIGLNSRGAGIVADLFRTRPTHAAVPIVTGLIVALAGTTSVARSLQTLYGRVFAVNQPGGMRSLPRAIAWVAVLLGTLIVEGIIHKPVRSAVGPVVQGLETFIVVTVFFSWTMHFLVRGRVPWRVVVRPALLTAFLWLCLALVSSVYFSSEVVSERGLYGTIGVVFTLASWFIAIGAVIVLGAVGGIVWQSYPGRRPRRGRDDPPSGGDMSVTT